MEKVETCCLRLKGKRKQQELTRQGWQWWPEAALPKHSSGGQGTGRAGAREDTCSLCFLGNGDKWGGGAGGDTMHHS